jgi:hypothetical protein
MAIVYGANYGRPTLDLNFAKNKSLIDTVSGQNLVTFTRSSTGTYVDSDGLIKTASANEPRFDHNPLTGESLGLLIEEQRINLLRQSIPENGLTRGPGIFSANATTAPDGTLTASLVTTGAYSSRWGWYNNYGSIPISGGAGVVSFYAKSNGSPWVGVGCGLGTPWSYSNAAYNLVTGASISYRLDTHGYQFKRATAVGNGWFRVEFDVITPSNSIPNGEFLMFNTALSGSGGDLVNAFGGDGVSGAYFWGLQVESGSFATSLIPTLGFTVTRSADVMSITGTNFSRWYNNTEGTAFVQTRNINSVNYSLAPFIGFDGSGGVWNNVQEWGVRYNYSTGNTFEMECQAVVYDSSGSSSALSNNQDARSSAKVAMGLNTTSVALSVNGNIQQVSRTGGTMPSINSLLWHSINNPKQSTQFSRFTYYPTRLQNYQLQQLTK